MTSIRKRAPAASSDAVRRVMQANVGRETTAESAIRAALRTYGVTSLENIRPEGSLRCEADIVFPDRKVCVFVDGCFWHRCPVHFALPKSNSEWWNEKINANVERDARNTHALVVKGWRVIRIWEHQAIGRSLEEAIQQVLREIA
jgi:DNA mismatch endonuclease (patch repair protein)